MLDDRRWSDEDLISVCIEIVKMRISAGEYVGIGDMCIV